MGFPFRFRLFRNTSGNVNFRIWEGDQWQRCTKDWYQMAGYRGLFKEQVVQKVAICEGCKTYWMEPRRALMLDREKYPKILDFLDENSYVPRERVSAGILSVNRVSHNEGGNATKANGIHRSTGTNTPLKPALDLKFESVPRITTEKEAEDSNGKNITSNYGFPDTHNRPAETYRGEPAGKSGMQKHSRKLHMPKENGLSTKCCEDVPNYDGVLEKRTGLATPSASSPAPSSVASGSLGRKCPICHKTPSYKEAPLVVCFHCKRGFHKACHTPEITQETLCKLGDRWQCTQCLKKLRAKSRTPKSLKRNIESSEDISEPQRFVSNKKAKFLSSDNDGPDIRIAIGKSEGVQAIEPSVNPRRKDEVERSASHEGSVAYKPSMRALTHNASVKASLAKSPRTLPWNQRNSNASSGSVTKDEVKRMHAFEPETSKQKLHRMLPSLRAWSPKVASSHCPRASQSSAETFIAGSKPAAGEGALVKSDNRPRSNQGKVYALKNDEQGDSQKKTSSNINIFAPVGTYSDPSPTLTVSNQVKLLERSALVKDKNVLGLLSDKEFKWGLEPRQLDTVNDTQVPKTVQSSKAYHLSLSLDGKATIEPASHPATLMNDSLPKNVVLDEDKPSTRVSDDEKDKKPSVQDDSKVLSPRDITSVEEPLGSTARIPEWLEAVSRDQHVSSQAGPSMTTTVTPLAPPHLSHKENESYQELSDASMSMDTSSSRRGELDGTGKYGHDPDEDLVIATSRHVPGDSDLANGLLETGKQSERSETLDQDDITAVQPGPAPVGSDIDRLLEGSATDKESSPPYSPPPAKVAEEPPLEGPVSKKPWLCNHQGCSNALAKFGKYGWCKLHAEEYEQSQSVTPLCENRKGSPDPISCLFEFKGPSQNSGENVAQDRSSKSSIQLSPSHTKSIRLRSEKGQRALSESNPKKAQEELEAEVSAQKNALSRYAKKVNELNKAVKNSNRRIENYEEEVQDLKFELDSKIQTVDKLNRNLLIKDQENAELTKERDSAKEGSNRLLQELEDCKKQLQELQVNEHNLRQERGVQEEENRDLVFQLQELRVELKAKQIEKPSHDAEKQQENPGFPAELQPLPISLSHDDYCDGRHTREKYNILDPTVDTQDSATGITPREKVSRKSNFYCFNTTTTSQSIYIHREKSPDHIQGLIGEFTLRKERFQGTSDEQSSSEGIDAGNQLSRSRSSIAGFKKNTKVRDTFEEFMGLSQDMVPMKINHKLVFRKAAFKQDGRGTRMERNVQSYRIGRNVPGELR